MPIGSKFFNWASSSSGGLGPELTGSITAFVSGLNPAGYGEILSPTSARSQRQDPDDNAIIEFPLPQVGTYRIEFMLEDYDGAGPTPTSTGVRIRDRFDNFLVLTSTGPQSFDRVFTTTEFNLLNWQNGSGYKITNLSIREVL